MMLLNREHTNIILFDGKLQKLSNEIFLNKELIGKPTDIAVPLKRQKNMLICIKRVINQNEKNPIVFSSK